MAAVRFKQADDAEKCVSMMNERQFGANQLQCELYDGVSDYRARPKLLDLADSSGGAAGGGAAGGGAAAAEEEERNLDGFADWLEADSTDEELDGAEDD